MAERETKLVYITLIRTRSPKIKKYLSHGRKVYVEPRARSSQFSRSRALEFSFRLETG
jgi:hypothetical protein